jgi:hypothetical protein
LADVYNGAMVNRVQAIEKEISSLSESEVAELAAWFWEHNDQVWLERMQRDAEEGKLDFLIREARAEYDSGKTKDL